MASSHGKSQESEREIHDMISKLTDRLVGLGQGTPEHEHHHHSHHDADHGVRMITLAGENKGAAMKAMSLDEFVDTQGMIYNDENVTSAYTNSNYQAVNNSIMIDGSCNAEDPGVHIIIADNFDDDSSSDDSSSDSDSEGSDEDGKKGNKEKKKKSKEKERKKKGKGKKEKEKKGKEKKEKEKKGKEKKGTSTEEDHSESEEEEEKGNHKEKEKVETD